MGLIPLKNALKLLVILLAISQFTLSTSHAQSIPVVEEKIVNSPLKTNPIYTVKYEKPVEKVVIKVSTLPKNCAKYEDLIDANSEKYGVRKEVLAAQLYKESGCRADAVSPTHDYGICQVNLPTHPKVTIAQAFDPAFCINFQAEKMSYFIHVKGNEYEALRAYNCGEGGANKNQSCGASYAHSILNMAESY